MLPSMKNKTLCSNCAALPTAIVDVADPLPTASAAEEDVVGAVGRGPVGLGALAALLAAGFST